MGHDRTGKGATGWDDSDSRASWRVRQVSRLGVESEFLEGGGQMLVFGELRSVFLADALGRREHFGAAVVRNLVLVGREFDREAVVISRVQRVEDAAIELVVAVA